jgi:hypothetical protein
MVGRAEFSMFTITNTEGRASETLQKEAAVNTLLSSASLELITLTVFSKPYGQF